MKINFNIKITINHVIKCICGVYLHLLQPVPPLRRRRLCPERRLLRPPEQSPLPEWRRVPARRLRPPCKAHAEPARRLRPERRLLRPPLLTKLLDLLENNLPNIIMYNEKKINALSFCNFKCYIFFWFNFTTKLQSRY